MGLERVIAGACLMYGVCNTNGTGSVACGEKTIGTCHYDENDKLYCEGAGSGDRGDVDNECE